MKGAKLASLVHADRELVTEIERARETLKGDLPTDRRDAVRARLEQLIAEYDEIEAMPTWPLNRRLRRRLTVANLVLVVPLVAQAVELAD